MNKVELTNMVEVTYCKDTDNNNASKTFLTAMVHVPEGSLSPMSEDDKKYGGRLLDAYFNKAAEILTNEMGPIYIYQNGFRFMGVMTMIYQGEDFLSNLQVTAPKAPFL